MKGRVAVFVGATGLVMALAYNTPTAAQRHSTPGAGQPASAGDRDSQQAVLAKYCVPCHNQKLKTGGLDLDTLNLADVASHAEEWEKFIRKVRTGAMPPVGRARPDKNVSAGLATWLETELDRAAFERVNPGRASLQRLNRQE